MYKVTKRDCPMFGIGPYVCEFICDTASDITTLPTSISEGTGGKTVYDNQKCASGSIANVADNGAESKQYMLNNQDIWCPYSVAAGSSDSVLEEAKAYTDSEIADLINGAPTTRDTLKEIADAMAENQTVVEALDAAIGTKANKTDIPTKMSQLENDSGYLTEHQDLSAYAKTADIPTELPANGGNADTLSLKGIDNFMHWRAETITDPDSCDTIGIYQWAIPTTNTNNPIAYGTLIVSNAFGYKCQIVIGTDTSVYIRHKTHDQEWSAWRNVSDGGNADTVNGHTVNTDVPADAKFTDTVPDLSLYALKSKYGDTTIDVGRKADTVIGGYSTAEGHNATASGSYSHAEGYNTTASANYAHAEGRYTTASILYSHAEGAYTTANNCCSHASGHNNADMTTGGNTSNTLGTAFVIGNGTSDAAKSNAFSVMFDGTVKAKSTITASTTADYAEFFEWLDGNLDGEDRVGYFVTIEGNKIRIANPDDDYILGVVSGEPFVLGNGDCDVWNGMFLRDEFRRTIYEPAPKMEEILDDDGNPTGEYVEVEGEYEGTRPKLNPDYDHTKKYTSRFDRPEWSPVGMLGVLAVRHDGTAKVNGYVTIADGGIATACDKNTENSYRVIKANTDSVVEIIFR